MTPGDRHDRERSIALAALRDYSNAHRLAAQRTADRPMIFGTENECRNAACGMEIRKGRVNDTALRQIRRAYGSLRRFALLDEQQPLGADLSRQPRRETIGRDIPGLRNV